jgi:hypothetical protein
VGDILSAVSVINNLTLSHMITAGEAADLIGPYVGLCRKNEEEELFGMLSLIQTKAWKKGVFKGMVKDFNVNIRKRTVGGKEKAYIITPHGYEIMLAVNLDGKPAPIHDNYFQFNNSGNGSITNCCGCNWSEGVIDIGEFPTLFQPCENKCCCGSLDCNSSNIGVISYECRDSCRDNLETVHVSGLTDLGNPVYTYDVDNPYVDSHDRCRAVDPKNAKKTVIIGDKFPIKRKLVVHKNIKWSRIDSIRKGYSDAPVEIFTVCGNSTQLLARIEPYQQASKYRIYELPDCCCQNQCVHGLFKIGKPEKIQHESQSMVIDDEEAIIALAKSFDLTYNKDKITEGEAFLQKGMQSLDDELRMNRSNAQVPIIVIGMEENESFSDFT